MSKAIKLCEKGKVSQLRKLLSEQPELLNYVNQNGYTPLSSACENSEEECVKLLLELGANVNLGAKRITPIFTALLTGDKNIVKMLLDFSANPNERGPDGFSLIHYAVQKKSAGIVRKLLQTGSCDVNYPAEINSERALHFAAQSGDQQILKLLVNYDGIDLDVQDSVLNTPLWYAAQSDRKEAMEILLRKGAKINKQCKMGQTVAHLIFQKYAEGSRPDLAEMLEKFGADFGIVDRMGRTPSDLQQITLKRKEEQQRYALLQKEILAEEREARKREIQAIKEASWEVGPDLKIWLEDRDLGKVEKALGRKRLTLSKLLSLQDRQLKNILRFCETKDRVKFLEHLREYKTILKEQEEADYEIDELTINWLQEWGLECLLDRFKKKKITYQDIPRLNDTRIRMLAKGKSEDLRETLLEAVSLAREQIDEFDERAALLDEQDFAHQNHQEAEGPCTPRTTREAFQMIFCFIILLAIVAITLFIMFPTSDFVEPMTAKDYDEL